MQLFLLQAIIFHNQNIVIIDQESEESYVYA
jgi:hypothetical protein